MERNIRLAMVMFLAQLLNVDINKQATREIDYLKEENQSLKVQLKQTRKCSRLTDG